MNSKITILQMYDNMQLGGAETHIITLSRQLEQMGHTVYIASPAGPALQWIKESCLKHVESKLNTPNLLHENTKEISRIIDDYKIDIIHTHPYHSQIVGALAGYFTHRPVITTIHGPYASPALQPEFIGHFERFICVSEEVKEHQTKNGCPQSAIQVIPNSVPILRSPKRNAFFKDNTITLCYISRLDHDKIKSLLSLLDSIPSLNKMIKLRLYILGNGALYEQLKTTASRINSMLQSDTIIMTGGLTDTNRYIADSDIVIGVGRVLLEALAAGKFAICIGNNHYPGLIDTDKLLWISAVNFTDRNTSKPFSLDAFTDDILKVYYNFDIEIKKLHFAHDTVCKLFNVEKSAASHVDIYKSVIENYMKKSV